MRSNLILTIENLEIAELEALQSQILLQFPQFKARIKTEIPRSYLPIYEWVKFQTAFSDLFQYPGNFHVFYADDVISVIRKQQGSYLHKLNGRYYIDTLSKDIDIFQLATEIYNSFQTCRYKKGWLKIPYLTVHNIHDFLDHTKYQINKRQSVIEITKYTIIDSIPPDPNTWNSITFDLNNSSTYEVKTTNRTFSYYYPYELFHYLKIVKI